MAGGNGRLAVTATSVCHHYCTAQCRGMQQAQDASYVGEYKAGRRHGTGLYTFSNGDSYAGCYADDLPNGAHTERATVGSCSCACVGLQGPASTLLRNKLADNTLVCCLVCFFMGLNLKNNLTPRLRTKPCPWSEPRSDGRNSATAFDRAMLCARTHDANTQETWCCCSPVQSEKAQQV
jgi:hypothetical protein